jgi:hypothetical protein
MNVDQIYDLLLEMELGTPATEVQAAGVVDAGVPTTDVADTTDAAESADTAEPSRSTGFGRYRNAALVGAGGLACAAVGALLGGLGGYFTVAPAAAHLIGATAQDTPLADAVNGAASHWGVGGHGSSAGGRATLADVEGSLTKGISTFSLFSPDSSVSTASGASGVDSDSVGSLGAGTAAGGGSGGLGGAGTDCLSGGADLTSLIDSVTCTLGSIGSLPGGGASGVLPSLSALVGEVTGTLSSLGVPGSLPTSTGLPLPGTSGGTGSLPLPSSGSLTGILNTVTAAANGVTKSAGTSLPLPTSGSSPTLPSLPVTTPTLPSASGAPTVTSSGGSTTVSVPTPSVPVPVSTTITVGGVSVGVNTGGSSPGATLNLP